VNDEDEFENLEHHFVEIQYLEKGKEKFPVQSKRQIGRSASKSCGRNRE
jgi:hypothetical protein